MSSFTLGKTDSINKQVFEGQQILLRADSIPGIDDINELPYNQHMPDIRNDIGISQIRKYE